MTGTRREFLQGLLTTATASALGGAPGAAAARGAEAQPAKRAPPGARMPVLFVGHGSPLNAIEDNRFSRSFAQLRAAAPRPSAILAISAHWFVSGSYLTASDRPRTIHDFSGFPAALHELDYPAPGSPALARRARGLLGEERAALASDWGLDHGTWSVLRWMYPEADIPVVQLSLDRRLDVAGHAALGRALAPLRDAGVLLLASGNLVHNLEDAFLRMRAGSHTTPDWALGFDAAVAEALVARDTHALHSRLPESPEGRLAHPTPEHWLPLLYAYAASDERDRVSFPAEGFDLGSISMRSIRFGSSDAAS